MNARHDELAKRFRAGQSYEEIAAEMGYTLDRVKRLTLRLRLRGRDPRGSNVKTSEQHAALVELYRGGASMEEIAEKLGYSILTVRRLTLQLGVREVAPHASGPGATAAARKVYAGMANEKHEELERLFRAGVSEEDIGKKLNYAVSTVRRIVLERGLRPRNSSGVRKITDAEIEQARRLLDDGASYWETAKTLGRDTKVIQRVLPGYRVLTTAERAERAVMGRQLARLERQKDLLSKRADR